MFEMAVSNTLQIVILKRIFLSYWYKPFVNRTFDFIEEKAWKKYLLSLDRYRF